MRFRISEHPSVLLFLVSLVILGVSIFLCYLYKWVIYADVAIALAGLAVIVLGYSMVKDILLFEKKKREVEGKKEKDDDRK